MGAREALSLLQWALHQLLAVVAGLLPREQQLLRLEGKLALVTGAGGGLGRELAKQLSAQGCRVVCVDSDLRAARGTAEVIGDVAGPGLACAYAADAADPEQALRLCREVLQRHGAVDVLLLAATPQRGEDAVRHLSAQFWMALGLVPAMAARGSGHVLAVCAEKTPSGGASTHSVATSSMIEALSEELRGTNVKLTCAYQYRLPAQELPLTISELSDACVAAEMLAALRRGLRHVAVPARTLFWHSVLRTLHLAADPPHISTQPSTSSLITSVPAAPHRHVVAVKS